MLSYNKSVSNPILVSLTKHLASGKLELVPTGLRGQI
ncbi:MAG: hypothetical protein ACI8XW_003668, partial [Gammaproteobacteria bacterium]